MSQSGILSIEGSDPQIPTSFITDDGTAIPISNEIELRGTYTVAQSIPVRTVGSGNTVTVEVQTSSAIASTDVTQIGLAAFNSANFTVDANGFVSLSGGGLAIDEVLLDTGISPIAPNGSGQISLLANTIGAHAIPIQTNGTAANEATIQVQIASAIAATDLVHVGLASFNSTYFTVDADGFVSSSGTGFGETITGNSGTISPTAGNWNIFTDNSTVKFAGTVSTLTQDFGLSNIILGSNAVSITSATNNVGVGLSSLNTLISGVSNTCVGSLAGSSITSGNENICIGRSAGAAIGGGGQNVIIGKNAALSFTNGSSSIIIGRNAGSAYGAGCNSNIIIGDSVAGVAAETNKIRIGQSGAGTGQQNACYIGGINGVDVGSVATVVTSSSDQLGTAVITAGTGITVTPAANTITIAVEDGGFVWNDISGAFSPLKNNGYFITGTATGTLPASPSQGDTIKFFVDHASQFLTIQASGSQIIRIGVGVSSAGGTQVSTAQGDSLELVYRSSDLCWCAVGGAVGTWTLT